MTTSDKDLIKVWEFALKELTGSNRDPRLSERQFQAMCWVNAVTRLLVSKGYEIKEVPCTGQASF